MNLLELPESGILVFVFLFGAIVGSFLNVYLYRFHTGKSLAGRSHCLSCGMQLRWFDLFPLLSYLCLRGRCRVCHSHIPPRYFLVEGLTATMFVTAYMHAVALLLVPVELFLGALLVLIVVYDLYHFIIPNEFVLLLILVAVLRYTYVWWLQPDVEAVLFSVGAALMASGVFAAMWYLSKGKWLGFGDVKLLFPLSLLVGVTGVFSLVVFSFWVGAITSLCLLGYHKWKNRGKHPLGTNSSGLTMKSEVPFAPFLIIGFMLVYYGGYDVLELMSHVYIY